METLIERLREKGYRLTPQRLAVLKVLMSSDSHPSVEEIHNLVLKDCPTTSLATTYKTIDVLKEMGEVLELEFRDGSNRYDGIRPEPHPHLVCTRCGRIQDLDSLPNLDLDALEMLKKTIARKTGYRISSVRLDFYGRCPSCL